MRKQIAISFLLISILCCGYVSAQVKIGDNPQTIDPTSVLELESTDRVLVITRVDSLQMTAIAPSRGALVYNTSADCIFYYNGTAWINLCGGGAVDGGGGPVGAFTTDPIVNEGGVPTIVITPTETGNNFEVAPNSISTSQITNGSIFAEDLNLGAFDGDLIVPNSITQNKLSENSVGLIALDEDNIDLNDFNNATGFIRIGDVISGDVGNAIIAGSDGSAFYDDAELQNSVDANTAAIAAGIAADGDTDDENELITDAFINDSNQLVLTEGGVDTTVDLSALANVGQLASIESTETILVSGAGTTENPYELSVIGGSGDGGGAGDDDQTATEVPVAANPVNYTAATPDVEGHLAGIDAVLETIGGGGGTGGTTEVIDGTTLTGQGTVGDPFKIEPGADGQFLSTNAAGEVEWSDLPAGTGDGGDNNQTADQVPFTPYLTIESNDVQTALQELKDEVDGLVVTGGGESQNLGQVLAVGTDANELGITNLSTDGDDDTAAATVGFVNAAVISGAGGLPNGNLLIGDDTSAAQPVLLSGDATLNNSGELTISNNVINSDKITDATIEPEDLSDMGATDGQILKFNGGVWAPANDLSGDGDTTANYTAGAGLSLSPTNEFSVDAATVVADWANITNIPEGVSDETDDDTTYTAGEGLVLSTENEFSLNASTIVADWANITNIPEGVSDETDDDTTYTAGSGLSVTSENQFNANADNATIVVNASNQLQVPEGGITTDKIQPSPTSGEILTTVGTEVVWAAPSSTGDKNIEENDATLIENRTVNLNGNNFIFAGSGNLGIGALPGAPQDKLDVDGQIRARRGFSATAGTANNPGYGFYTNNDSNMGMFRAAADQLAFSTNSVEAMRIDNNQNVGVGTINPNRNFHVAGEVQFDSDVFLGLVLEHDVPDYVFQKYFHGVSKLKTEYNFKSLKEIETFVKKYHHLPGIKSAAQVKEDGAWNLSESNLQNLEKIEELYLHTIEQEKKIDALESEKEVLSNEVKALRADLEEIKTMLEKSK